jgi:uncharacterized repeat protein (TIGR02543 family)
LTGALTLPNSVTSIGDGAFWGCSGLTEITNLSATPQSISSTVFSGFFTQSACRLRVASSSLALYEAAPVWQDFAPIIGLDNVQRIDLHANGGSVSPSFFYLIQGEAIGSFPRATRAGYIFSGWNTQPDGSGTEYTAATVYNATDNTTLYAQWTANVTGVGETLHADISACPNPFKGALRLTGAVGCTLTVFTTTGSLVHTQKVTGADETIHLERLPAGLYLFRLEKDGKTKTLKIVNN